MCTACFHISVFLSPFHLIQCDEKREKYADNVCDQARNEQTLDDDEKKKITVGSEGPRQIKCARRRKSGSHA